MTYCPKCGAKNADNANYCEGCGESLKEDKDKPQTKKVSTWLQVVCWAYAILYLIGCYSGEVVILSLIGLYSVEGAIGTLIGLIIGIVIMFLCAKKNSKWATEINKSINLAYAIGFFFSLSGLLGYWIYYKSEKKKI